MGRLLKKCNDQRFLRVQERLFNAIGHFLKRNTIASVGVTGLSSRAKIWDSTFYDHFRNMDDAIQKYNHRHDKAITELRDEVQGSQISMELTMLKILRFIKKHKNYYGICINRQNLIPFFSIAKIFRPIFTQSWSNYGREKFDLCFKIFCGELFGVICYWGCSEKFDDSKIQNYANYLSYLVQNTTRRLS